MSDLQDTGSLHESQYVQSGMLRQGNADAETEKVTFI